MPKLSINLTDEQMDSLDKFLPWGTKQAVMVKLVENLVETVKQHGTQVIGPIMTGDFNLVSKLVRKE